MGFMSRMQFAGQPAYCELCGKEIIVKYRKDRMLCPTCRQRETRKDARQKGAAAKGRTSTLSEVARAARELGMSYGNYVVMEAQR